MATEGFFNGLLGNVWPAVMAVEYRARGSLLLCPGVYAASHRLGENVLEHKALHLPAKTPEPIMCVPRFEELRLSAL
jgi:hypothetical protein